MKIKSLALTLVLVFIFTGCLKKDIETPVNLANETNYGTKIFLSECSENFNEEDETQKTDKNNPMGNKSFVSKNVLSDLAVAAVSKGFDLLSTAVKKWGKDKVVESVLYSNIDTLNYYSPSKASQCIYVVRGNFEYFDDSSNKDKDNYKYLSSNNITGIKNVATYKIHNDNIELYAEILIDRQSNFIRFIPVDLIYNGNKALDAKNPDNARDLNFIIGIANPSLDITTQKLSKLKKIDFGSVKAPFEKKFYYTNKLLLDYQTQWLPLKKEDITNPSTIVVKVYETIEAGQFKKFLATALEKNEDKIKTKLTEAIQNLETFKSEQDKKDAEITGLTSSLKKNKDYNNAFITSLEKKQDLIDYCSRADRIKTEIMKLQNALYEAEVLADEKAIEADIKEPYKKNYTKVNGSCE